MIESIAENEDLKRWQIGTAKFAKFWKIAKPIIEFRADQQMKDLQAREILFLPKTLSPLQAVFLGEKPAIFHDLIGYCLSNNELETFGLKRSGAYVYDPLQISAIRNKHADVLDNELDNEAFMQQISNNQGPGASLEIGLILGFPRAATEKYCRAEKTVIKKIAAETRSKIKHEISEIYKTADTSVNGSLRQGYGYKGVLWVDWPNENTSESEAYEARLKEAFERSGILEIKL